MADFGVRATELSGPSSAGSAPLQAVQPQSQKFNMGFLDGVGAVVGELIKGDAKTSRIDMAVNDYSEQLNKINQASITGQMSSSEADRKRREVWSTTQTKYGDVPAAALQQALDKQFKAASGASGIDDEMTRAKEMRKREDDMVFEGAKLGIYDVKFATNPDTRDMALDMMQTYYDNTRKLEMAGKQYERSRQMVENGQKDMKFQQDQDKLKLERAAKDFFQNNSTKYGDVVGSLTANLVEKVRSGQMQGEDAIFQIQAQVNSFRGQANAALTYDTASQSRLNQYLDSLVDNAKYQMDPKNITEFTKERNALAVAKRQAALMQQDDFTTTLSAFRGLIGDTAFSQVAGLEVSTKLLGNFSKVAATGNTTVVQDGDKNVQKITYGSINKAVDTIKSGATLDAGTELADVEKHTKAIIQNMGTIRDNNPVKLTETVNFLAGPSVKYLIEQKKLSPVDMMEAGEVYKTLYRGQLMGTVSQMLSTKVEQGPMKGYAGGNVPIAQLVDFNVDDNGVVNMVPKWDDKDFNKSYAAQVRATTELRDINKQMSAINTAIKVGAHMEGRTDYKKYFEENASLFLPTFMPDKKFIEEQAQKGYKYLGGNRYNPRNWVKTGGKDE